MRLFTIYNIHVALFQYAKYKRTDTPVKVVDLYKYAPQNSTFTRQTKYAPPHYSPIYNNVYIGTGSTSIHKGHLNNTTFVLARLAQMVEHHILDHRAVCSNTTVSKNFSFCIFRFRLAPGRSTGAIHTCMKSSMTFIRVYRCIERTTI